MAHQNAARKRRRGAPPLELVAEPGDHVLVQCRLPSAAAEQLKDQAKAQYTSVAAVVRTMLLERLGFLPAPATPTKDNPR